MCFCTDAFDEDTFQCAFISEGRLSYLLSSIRRYDYFVCRVYTELELCSIL